MDASLNPAPDIDTSLTSKKSPRNQKRTAENDQNDAEERRQVSFWEEILRWTGIPEKKGWDVLQLLITASIPLLVFFGTQSFTTMTNKKEQEVADDKQKDEVLKNYFEDMKGLLLHEKHPLKKDSESKSIARTLTLTTLSQLTNSHQSDTESRGKNQRKGLVVQFLWESNLITESTSVVELSRKENKKESDLLFRPIVNLDSANLIDADLSSANLSYADLQIANLSGANLGCVANIISSNKLP